MEQMVLMERMDLMVQNEIRERLDMQSLLRMPLLVRLGLTDYVLVVAEISFHFGQIEIIIIHIRHEQIHL